jgi:hypothetical protein
MQFKYLNWYTQAIGATFGMLSCIFGYLNGFMFVLLNDPSKYIENIGILGVISSYTLLPFCILTFILALIRSYTIEIEEKKLFGFSFLYLNNKISILTVVLGIIGSRHFFIIPAILILFNQHSYKFIKKVENNEELDSNNKTEEKFTVITENSSENIDVYVNLELEKNLEIDSHESSKEFT